MRVYSPMLLLWLACAVSMNSDGNAAMLYWSVAGPGGNWDVIQKTRVGSNELQTIVGEVSGVGIGSMAVDAVGEKIYWYRFTNWPESDMSIWRANLDGSEAGIVTGLSHPVTALVVDATADKVCWTGGYGGGKISCSNRDGSGRRELPSEMSGQVLAVDSQNGYLFSASGSRLRRSKLDGSEVSEVLNFGVNNTSNGVVFDVANETVYWIDASQHSVNKGLS